jgi:hypothetical protein
MGMHIRLWKDQSHTKIFRDFTTGIIAEYGNYTGTIQTVTINDKVYYYANTAVFSGVNAVIGTPVVSSKDDLGTQSDPIVNIFWPDQDFKAVISGRVDGTGGSERYRATLGNIRAGSTTICASTAGYQSTTAECDVWAYTIRLQGFDVDFVYITQDKIDGYIGSSYGIMVSANVFETSTQPRGGRDKIDGDEDSGYGDGEGGDGHGGTDLPTENAMPIGGTGIHAYSISHAAYNDISSFMWGKDENVFSSLWSKFQYLKFSPMAGIINCIKIPSPFAPLSTAGSKIRIAGIVLDVAGYELATAGAQYASTTFSRSFGGFYGDFNDHSNVRCTLHLPFCGAIDISPSAIANRTLNIVYFCDILTGNVSARVETTANSFTGNVDSGGGGNFGGFIAQATGNCAYSVPISGNDNGMGDKLATLTGFATSSANGAASVVSGGMPSAGDILTASPIGMTAGMLMAKHTTSVVGSLGGGVGNIADLQPRLTVERIAKINPLHYDSTAGIMSATGGVVGDYSGFTVFSSVNVSVPGATDEEAAEIERLLKEGVYV